MLDHHLPSLCTTLLLLDLIHEHALHQHRGRACVSNRHEKAALLIRRKDVAARQNLHAAIGFHCALFQHAHECLLGVDVLSVAASAALPFTNMLRCMPAL